MFQARCWGWALAALAAGFGATGCLSPRQTALLKENKDSLAADMEGPAEINTARMQRPDPKGGPPRQGSSPLFPSGGVVEAQPTSLRSSRNVKVTVRAYVNGRPIFDDEIMQALSPRALNDLQSLGEPQRSERLAEVYNAALDTLIEQELGYQEAVRKLEGNNPRGLDKLKDLANTEFEKQIAKIQSSGKVTDEELREVLPTLRRSMERSLISMEYMRSRIFQYLQSRIGHEEVREYYDTHKNEFVKQDSVQWQNVFIAVNAQRPTVAHCQQFAQQLLAQARTGEDFAKLAAYDDGDSKFRNGQGFGSRKGEIKPAELEDYLFNMRDGEVGPIVNFETGVHLFRLVRREYGGQVPLNEQVQTQIRAKLRSQVAEREYKRIVRELKARAVIEIEREGS